jgi:hypothetical protein
MLDNGFMTGCDSETEWQLPWFVENFKKHNSTHLLVVDFGMSTEMAKWAGENVDSLADMSTAKAKGWFIKPIAMMNTPFDKTVWIDTDCEVVGNLDRIFNQIVGDKLNMVLDRPWSKKFGTTMYNSGVVGFHRKPAILAKWAAYVDPSKHRGDQEALHMMLDDLQRMVFINELQHKYNVLRLDHLSDTAPANRLVNHWTGAKGNTHIRMLMGHYK